MSDYVANTYFEVMFGAPALGLSGRFTSVSGLAMEFEYETVNEAVAPTPGSFLRISSPRPWCWSRER